MTQPPTAADQLAQTSTADPTQALAVEDVNITGLRRLIAPAQLEATLPPTEANKRTVLQGREAVKRIIDGADPRPLVIVGPCSIHDPKAALEYAQRLAGLREEVADRMEVMMRVYFEKPRTTVGWKGLINDPHLDGRFDLQGGLHTARELLLKITGMGLPTATEVLDPITPQYLADLLCWTAIGARTTESQTHRQMASGLSMPVGFKNRTDGELQVALDAMLAAREPHHFLGIDKEGRIAIIDTKGNPWGHIILRGGTAGSNFAPESLAETERRLREADLRSGVMIDCSHANSGKQHQRQRIAWQSCIDQRAAGNTAMIGLMLESNLVEGKQKLTDSPADLAYGVSITDACIGWDETAELIREGASKLAGHVG